LGYACAVEPYVAAGVMAPALLGRLRAHETHAETFNAVLSGDHLTCIAWQNANGSLDPMAGAVAAHANGEGYTLSGTCRFVPVAHADSFLVVAKTGDVAGIYLVPSDTAGVNRETEPTADGGFSAALTFTSAKIPNSSCLATGEAASAALREALDLGTLANSAELLGNMERSVELTLDYLKTRKQFGQAIGSFQVLQHRSVDLWMKMQVSRHALDAAIRTAMAADVPAPARTRAASSAKYRAAAEAHFITNECIQLHGAIGFTDEYDLGLYANRSLAIVPFLGNATEHRRRYSTLKQTAGARP